MVKIKDGRTVEVGDKVILTRLTDPAREYDNVLEEGHAPTVKVTYVCSRPIGRRTFKFEPEIEGMRYFSEDLGDRFEFVDEGEQAVEIISTTGFARIDELSNGDVITVYHIYNSHGDLVTLTTPKTVKVKNTNGHYALLEEQVSGLVGLGPDDLFTIDFKAPRYSGKDKVEMTIEGDYSLVRDGDLTVITLSNSAIVWGSDGDNLL